MKNDSEEQKPKILFMQKFWRATVDRFFAWIHSFAERKRIRESFVRPIVKRRGRETLAYYERGRSTAITCDLALGRKDLDILIYYKVPLIWLDTGEPLTSEESEKIYSNLPDLLKRRHIRWAYSETLM